MLASELRVDRRPVRKRPRLPPPGAARRSRPPWRDQGSPTLSPGRSRRFARSPEPCAPPISGAELLESSAWTAFLVAWAPPFRGPSQPLSSVLSKHELPPPGPGARGVRLPPESAFGILRNPRSESSGIRVRIGPESPFGFPWNPRSGCSGSRSCASNGTATAAKPREVAPRGGPSCAGLWHRAR